MLRGRSLASALAVFIVASGMILPSLSIGLLSDDFSWLRVVRDTAGLSWAEYLKIPSPYGYFRPVPMAVFRTLGLALPGQAWPFRALIIVLHLSNCLLLYLLGKRLDYPQPSVLAACLLFAVLPGHAEALFWISALNEPLSAFLLLLGFYLLLSVRVPYSVPFSALLFTAAMGSRESSLCYLPLLLLLALRRPSLSSPLVIPALLLPGALYLSFRWWWTLHLPPGIAASSPGALSLNLLEIGRRLAHYLMAMAVPAKSLFGILGFEKFEALRCWLSSPSAFPALYWASAAASLSALIAAAWFLLKRRAGGLAGPLAFIALALSVYLPFRNTSEHFLYFPSLGFCLTAGIVLHSLSLKKAGIALAMSLALFTIYASSRAERLYRWHQASIQVERALEQLSALTSGLPDGTKVLVNGLDNRYFGIPFMGEHSVQDAWDWRNPRRPLTLYFDRTGRDGFVINYSPGSFSFSRAE